MLRELLTFYLLSADYSQEQYQNTNPMDYEAELTENFKNTNKMKNFLSIDIDTDREETVRIGKLPDTKMPKNKDDYRLMVIEDQATLCEALCTMIHLAEDEGLKSSSDCLMDCIKHLQSGFADASYKTKSIKK